ncbi:hypothetical protein Sjap_004613 [Stephania japonica]|uniref:Secreted protein n=1 Tax=Stephania japonica TaxID=461633 RepID=A0AAP0K3J7_9MAGN
MLLCFFFPFLGRSHLILILHSSLLPVNFSFIHESISESTYEALSELGHTKHPAIQLVHMRHTVI